MSLWAWVQLLRRPKFKPGVFYNEDLRLTEIILKDCFTVWCPWGPYKGHAVDLGYDHNGDLVGIKIWDDVRFQIGEGYGDYYKQLAR